MKKLISAIKDDKRKDKLGITGYRCLCCLLFFSQSAPTTPYSTACSNASEYCWLLEFSNKKRKEGRMSHHLQKFLHNSSILYLYLHYKLPIFHHDDEILTFIRRHGRRECERANEETPLSKTLSYWAPL